MNCCFGYTVRIKKEPFLHLFFISWKPFLYIFGIFVSGYVVNCRYIQVDELSKVMRLTRFLFSICSFLCSTINLLISFDSSVEACPNAEDVVYCKDGMDLFHPLRFFSVFYIIAGLCNLSISILLHYHFLDRPTLLPLIWPR